MRPASANCDPHNTAQASGARIDRQTDAAILPASLLLSADFSATLAATCGPPVF